MKFQFKSITTRLIVWFLAIFSLSLFIVMAIIYRQRVDYIRADEFNKLIAIRDLKVIQLNNWLDERIGDIEEISSDYEIRGLEEIFDKDKRDEKDEKFISIARDLIKRYGETFPAFYDIYIINSATGKIEISTDESIEGKDRSENLYFTEPLKIEKLYIKDIYYSKIMGHAVMAFSIPIYGLNNKDKIIGAVVCRINLENSLYKLLQNRTGMGETGKPLL